MLKETDYGIGYDEQGQDNTAGPDEVRRLRVPTSGRRDRCDPKGHA